MTTRERIEEIAANLTEWAAAARFFKRFDDEEGLQEAANKLRAILADLPAESVPSDGSILRVVDRMHKLFHAYCKAGAAEQNNKKLFAAMYQRACMLEVCCDALYETIGVPLDCEPGDPCPVSIRLERDDYGQPEETPPTLAEFRASGEIFLAQVEGLGNAHVEWCEESNGWECSYISKYGPAQSDIRAISRMPRFYPVEGE